LINRIRRARLKLSIDDGKLKVKGKASLVSELSSTIKRWKPELIKTLEGKTVKSVGDCDRCDAELLGLLVHGDYINRVCPECGKWFRCLEPNKHQRESNCAEEHQIVESKVAASLAGLATDTQLTFSHGVEY